MKYYLAIDIGASSGRHILGSVENGKLCLEEVYRFENGIKNENGVLVWDTEKLFQHVKNGIRRCREIGKEPKTVAIDTWGVDCMERQEIQQNHHTEGLLLHPTHPQDHWPHQMGSGAYFVHTSG